MRFSFFSLWMFVWGTLWAEGDGSFAGVPEIENSEVEVAGVAADEAVSEFVDFLFSEGRELESVRFADVIFAVSGFRVLPMNAEDEIDREILDFLNASLDETLLQLREADHSVHTIGRVNEISRKVEDVLIQILNSNDRFEASVPKTVSGKTQRSGYPDIRLCHLESGRVVYVDPKIYRSGSERSSFRTFYFEPQIKTNKVLEDASHLIAGVAHGGKVDGLWQFQKWKLVDLSDFKVRLKAEFQASNRDLYREEAVLSESLDEESAWVVP